MIARILLLAGLALVTIGTAIVFVGVVSPSVFYPGVYLIEIGTLVLAVAGVLSVVRREAVE
jgi:hypothetical protein